MPEAVSAGIVLHAVETAAGICFGAASAMTLLGRVTQNPRVPAREACSSYLAGITW